MYANIGFRKSKLCFYMDRYGIGTFCLAFSTVLFDTIRFCKWQTNDLAKDKHSHMLYYQQQNQLWLLPPTSCTALLKDSLHDISETKIS